MNTTTAIRFRFFFNGIKVNGRMFRCFFSMSREDGSIGVSVRGYESLPSEVRSLFAVTNSTDTMTDYFDSDHFTIPAGHALWPAAFAAYTRRLERDVERLSKRRPTYYDLPRMRRELAVLKATDVELTAFLAGAA